MLSHYADFHKGICFGFNPEKDEAFFHDCHAVKYVKDFINANLLKEGDLNQNLTLRKHVGWSYEREFRIIRGNEGTYPFRPEALTEILLGCRMKNAMRERIIDAVEKK